MTAPSVQRRVPGRALLLALAALACGPYAQLAQKLDVTARVAGDTWIGAVGPEVRVLLVGDPREDGTAAFAFTAMQMPISRGTSAAALQGTWTEVGNAGDTTVQVEHTYTLPDESGVPILSRRGSWRDDERRTVRLTVTRAAGRLVVAGDDRLAGTYVPMTEALGRLGTATERDATCAFHVANLGIRSSEVRIIGFGGPGMTQYQEAETYVGTIAGSLRVSMSGGLGGSTTTIRYDGFEDLGGVRVSGPQTTDADSGGNGHMSGVVTFALSPVAADGTAGAPITGSIDYGGAGDPVRISNGDAIGGVYLTSIDGGATAPVRPETAPSPSVSECLALP